jgi:glutamine amidotransferase
MQLLFDQSSENNITSGLKLLSGNVEKFPKKNNYKIPQIQWNEMTIQNESKLMNGLSRKEFFYFLHSFYVDKETVDARNIGTTNYSEQEYVSLIEKDNVFGVQFHPEKSSQTGLNLLQNFIRM